MIALLLALLFIFACTYVDEIKEKWRESGTRKPAGHYPEPNISKLLQVAGLQT